MCATEALLHLTWQWHTWHMYMYMYMYPTPTQHHLHDTTISPPRPLDRLEQEVWSNSLVVASFYGPVHSTNWWMAAIVSTAIPAFYCFTGGMRASLFTDVFQVGYMFCQGGP